MDIVIAGGGVAGLEGLLALHAIAGDSVRLSLVAPDPEFSYRPLAVAEPFALGHAHRVPLSRFAEETSAELVIDAVVEVGDGGGEVRLHDGRVLGFEALLLAPGGRAAAGLEGATTWRPGGDSEDYRGLLRDIDGGYTKRLAIVVPPGAVWPLPAYELALMTAGEARRVGHDDVQVIIVTPERGPFRYSARRPPRRSARSSGGPAWSSGPASWRAQSPAACSWSRAASDSTFSASSRFLAFSPRASRGCRRTSRGSSAPVTMLASRGASGRGQPATGSCRR
jgi:hypothetical protein